MYQMCEIDASGVLLKWIKSEDPVLSSKEEGAGVLLAAILNPETHTRTVKYRS
jgi:DNA-directed RNA polymerase subunit H (RpoH/RPB5)